jgi:3-phenylpropionate/trans-cinnamate dioxygenase ferredoxin reductase subunit
VRSIVVVGASLAGLRASEELRYQGYDGTITLVGDEPHRPYDRPPLSKQVLAGDWELDRTVLTTTHEGGVDALDLDWRLGQRATGLNLRDRTVELAGGDRDRVAFDGLVIATGATPRRLPGTGHLAGIHTLRSLDDCLALRAELDASPQGGRRRRRLHRG